MKNYVLRGFWSLAALLMAGASQETFAHAQSAHSTGYAANALDPASPGSDWFTTESLDLRGHFRPQIGLLVDWAYAPMVIDHGGPTTRVLTDQVNISGRASMVFSERFRFGVSSPLTIYEHGDDPSFSPSREQAPGDLRLDADAMLFGRYGKPIRMAGGLELFVPFGRRDLFTSDGTFRIAPRISLAGDLKWFAWAAKASFMYRPFDGHWNGRELGSQVQLAFSAGVQVNDRFTMGPELHGATVVTGDDAFATRATPIEALIGGKVRVGNDWQVGSAIGGRFTDGDGSAKMRVLGVLEYAPDVCVDKDGDGICAYEDACPNADGPRTHRRKTNGCPVPEVPPPPSGDEPPGVTP